MITGIFPGSFDPIHNGHTSLASWIATSDIVDEVWLSVTPENPFKPYGYEASDEDRLIMANLATANLPCIKTSDLEFSLPRPSFTYDTLCCLREKYPDRKFKLIIGADNWIIFEHWKDSCKILYEFGVIVYPRPNYNINIAMPENAIYLPNAPIVEISSTAIRHAIAENYGIEKLVHPDVANYITTNRLYKITGH